ncbi:hypothetical protein RJ639_043974 [Escallonia herrerae]|uniref:Reverse transcriptase RNase H-like domain-containing protein n=1 Tax=Escallonia herrerae TaxID=1293975 RepID=A0AA88WIM5_9ASTE|nr:hypothetical protein RJ639_043974 [Escallonia herrerae]
MEIKRREQQQQETRYPKIDRIALALIISARRLRPYFQSHSIIVLTDQSLRKVLLSPEASGRLVNWSLELGEFDIQYKPHTAIKAQALADFIVECTLPEDHIQLLPSNFGVLVETMFAYKGLELHLINTFVPKQTSINRIRFDNSL